MKKKYVHILENLDEEKYEIFRKYVEARKKRVEQLNLSEDPIGSIRAALIPSAIKMLGGSNELIEELDNSEIEERYKELKEATLKLEKENEEFEGN